MLRPPRSTLFPYATLFRSVQPGAAAVQRAGDVVLLPAHPHPLHEPPGRGVVGEALGGHPAEAELLETEPEQLARSEEHTSELQSRQYLVCRLLLETKSIVI